MGHKDRESVTPRSLTPETELIDSSWDDDSDLVSGIELAPVYDEEEEDDGDRVTAIPDMPAELLAQQLMARTPASAPPEVPTEDAASLHDRETPTEGLQPRPPSLELPFAHRSAPAFELGEEATLQAAPQAPWMSPSTDDLDLSPAADLELELPVPELEPAAQVASPYQEMKDRYAMGDFTGALVTAESLLETDAEDEQALRYAESCRDVLTQMYAARLGPLTQTVRVGVPPDQIRWLSLDHRAGFLLSMVDGTSSIEEILDVSGMTRLDALRILFTLLEQQVIVLEPGLD